jgi:tetratricopeptide (TPR) repeat protein
MQFDPERSMSQSASSGGNKLVRRLVGGLVAVSILAAIAFGIWILYQEVRVAGWEREARAAGDRREFGRALELWERCMEARPDDAETAFQAARAARRAGDSRKADQFLKEAERLGWVENALLLERSLLRVQRGGIGSEQGYLLACVQGGHPDTVLILEILVPALTQSFDIAPALHLLERWQELEPRNPAIHFARGEIHELLRNRAKAVESFQEALRLAPEYAEAHLKCGKLLIEEQRAEEALPHFEWLATERPGDAAVRLGLARCKIALNAKDEGRRLLDDLLVENPNNGEVLAERGKLELSAGNAESALAMLRRANDLLPNDPQLLYAIGQCWARLGNKEEAQKYWDQQTRAEEDLKRMGALKQAAAANPSDPKPRHEAGLILMRNGYHDSGVAWLQTALRVDPGYVPAHEALAEYHERIKDLQRAEFHRRMAKQHAAHKPSTGSRGQ